MRKITLIVLMLFSALSYAQTIELNGTVSAQNHQIKNVSDPTEVQDAVTKAYIDALIANLESRIYDLEHPLTDVDGNSYDFITYGTQTWTVSNAAMETYRDGTVIPQVTVATDWAALTTGAWCYYYNDETKGKLYNWYAVMGIHDNEDSTANKEFAPEGWHVPSDAKWTTLEEYLITSGYNYDNTTTDNKIAKAMVSTTGWYSSANDGAIGNDQSLNNSSDFNVFPEGICVDNGSFFNGGLSAYFWSSTENNTYDALSRSLGYSNRHLDGGSGNKLNGFSVRFVRD